MHKRWSALWKYREHQRDVARQQLALVCQRQQTLEEHLAELLRQRQQMLQEMNQLQALSPLPVDALSWRRYHANRLLGEIRQVEQAIRQVQEEVLACRARLVAADQQVKMLERLRERWQVAEAARTERRSQLDREEQWQASQDLTRPAETISSADVDTVRGPS
ncbi:MAG: hypothetical protein KatS3mg114_0386 [Planctomycetaceae bacterium]|nr:MAG: hypothetical protein KatS3mg114_0386 [Planctomycetaceae bacterium]